MPRPVWLVSGVMSALACQRDGSGMEDVAREKRGMFVGWYSDGMLGIDVDAGREKKSGSVVDGSGMCGC